MKIEEDDVPDFPRGGRSALSRQEKNEIREEVEAEFRAGDREQKKNKKRKRPKSQSHTTEDELGSLFGDGFTGKLPRFANKITLKNIYLGMKIWGIIAEVNEKDLEISLPGGLRGLVRSSEAFDPVLDNDTKDAEGNSLSSMFQVGQLVSCIVLQLDDDKKEKGMRKIWLSMRLSLLHKGLTLDAIQKGRVLSAYVKSIEDHGYILHFGSSSFAGFLPKNQTADSNAPKLNLGQLVQGIVRNIDTTRKVVYLGSDSDVSKHVMKDLKGISIDLLVPGMMVNAIVKSTLENGIMCSFLTFFTGTVDLFHLQNPFASTKWKDDYNKNKKVNARILFIDPSTRAIGLTLNPHLVQNRAPPSHVKNGDIFEHAKIVRVDKGFGLLLEIPSIPVPIPAYVSIFDATNKEGMKLEKKFKEGNQARIRILGFRHLEGLATGVMKANAFEGEVFTHSDVKPGMVVRAKVVIVDTFGAIVQFPSGVKALCPIPHMSEFEIAKPGKKFKVGAELTFRVLGCKSKRITVTHKKTLVKSKLAIISSYVDATDGLITHGWITNIEKHGCFVRFYNGVQGFAPGSELGLEPGSDTSLMYHVGQVIKCRVTSSVPTFRRINLSFVITPSRVSEDDMVKLGSLVSGMVEKLTPNKVIVHVNAKGFSKGIISTEHLADHHGQAALIKTNLKLGYMFDQLLVLEIEGDNLILSAKYSLINSIQQLPQDLTQIRPQSVVHGYICNIIESGCFVRFLGRLTGFSPRKKATDDPKAQISDIYYNGQSVRSNILNLDSETGRITLSLKQSYCSSIDASFIQSYFLVEEKIAQMQLSEPKSSDLWVENFNIGGVVEGKIHGIKDVGAVISFEKYDDVFGFISHYQFGDTKIEMGAVVRAVVLDVSKSERIVDLSLKSEFIDRHTQNPNSKAHKKKRKREAHKDIELHQTVTGIVEILKETYLVLSIPDHNYAVGYTSILDYNTQKLAPKKFCNGESVVATVMAVPSPSTGGRLLLLLKSISEASETSISKRAKKKSGSDVGSVVQAEIIEIKPLELRLKFGTGFHGRVHVTEVNDSNDIEDPFSHFKIGQTVTAKIVDKPSKSKDNKKGYNWELSINPAVVTVSNGVKDKLTSDDFSIGQCVTGYVYKLDNDWVWLTISRQVRARLFILDSSCEPTDLVEFQKQFTVGKSVAGYILSINKEKNILRIVGHVLPEATIKSTEGDDSNENYVAHIHEGKVVGGRVSKILPGVSGMLVEIGPRLYGKVHFTEITDLWVSDPLSGYREGQFVKCKVLGIGHSAKGTVHVDLSIRVSFDGVGLLNIDELGNTVDSPRKHVEKIEDLHPNMVVQGYVKNVTPKGCFILLSRTLDAKVLISNLSDGFVENPEKEFPIGKLVTGKVLSVEPLSKRVEVTLRSSSDSGAKNPSMIDMSGLHVGEIVSGRIRRVELYGLFITIDNTNMVGLCHVSELSDDPVENIESKYKAGERVRVKILKVDEERHRISLRMKNLNDGNNMDPLQIDNETSEVDNHIDDIQLTMLQENGSHVVENFGILSESSEGSVLVQAESRASIIPLEVALDDIDNSDVEKAVTKNQEHVDKVETRDKENRKQAKAKEREEREKNIRVAEERLLANDAPKSADEFEKLIRSSPNSSYLWIKYMAFMLSLADVEKARAIAERALQSINFREEAEKLNVWVAYFNLENEYGNPPQEAVAKIFQRALQFCDEEKVHLALLAMYERTGQHDLADELFARMAKKFKHSFEVWAARVEGLVKHNRGGVESVLARSLGVLPKDKHVRFISHTAVLEFKFGVPDKGRSLFEDVLRDFPKRTDVWMVYLDQEIRLGDVDLIRSLFERTISLSLPNKTMKSLFKKYLNYEKSLGDKERIEYVKKTAMAYAENHVKA